MSADDAIAPQTTPTDAIGVVATPMSINRAQFVGLATAALSGSLLSTQTARSQTASVARNGSVYVSEFGSVRVHSYSSPADGFMVNTQIVEGANKLVIFDAQMLLPYAREAAAYVRLIGKPIERIILSHGHGDHWSGLQVFTEEFPGVDVFAVDGVAELVRTRGEATLKRAKGLYGDRAATKVVVPTRVLEEGEQEIDGAIYDFKRFVDGESEVQLVALLPQQKLLLAFDLIFSPTEHAFTIAPFFDHWVAVLEQLKGLPSYDTVMVGHYWPLDRTAIDGTITYVMRAKEIHATAATAHDYSERLIAAFPERQQRHFAEYSAGLLYGQPR